MPTDLQFQIGYATSSRARCRTCSDSIGMGSLRIAQLVQSKKFDGMMTMWHHFRCFTKARRWKSLLGTSSMQLERFKNWDSCRPDDISKLKKWLGVEADGDAVTTKGPTDPTTFEGQRQLLWALRDGIKSSCSRVLVKELLELNHLSKKGGDDEAALKLASAMLFGPLQPCPKCGGEIRHQPGGPWFVCGAHATSWAKCQYFTKTPERGEFSSAGLDKGNDFLVNFRFEPLDFVAPADSNVEPFSAPDSGATSVVSKLYTAEMLDPSKLKEDERLKGDNVMVVGRLGNMNQLSAKTILKGAGAVARAHASSGTTFVVAGRKVSEAVKQACEEHGVPAVSAEYLSHLDSSITDYILPTGTGTDTALATRLQRRLANLNGVQPVSLGQGSAKAHQTSVQIKGGAAVDASFKKAKDYHVLRYKGRLMTATLNTSDVVSGYNSFYILQVLEKNNRDKLYLHRHWGRTGTDIGDSMQEAYFDVGSACHSFRRLYHDKTGNSWSAMGKFKKLPGKFYPVDLDYGDDAIADDEDEKPEHFVAESVFDPRVRELVKTLFDIKQMRSDLATLKIDSSRMPLGRLSQQQLRKGYKVLSKISEAITEAADDREVALADGSNRFYTVIPHDFGTFAPPVIDTLEAVKEKTRLLDMLSDLVATTNIIRQGRREETRDVTYGRYLGMKCALSPVSLESEEAQLIARCVANTHAPTHTEYKLQVLRIFKADREGESSQFASCPGRQRRLMLWHGSRATNLGGILSQGLRIAPKEAPVSGYMFGKGIYLADMVSKSANYCNPQRTVVRQRTRKYEGKGFLLLVEAAVGQAEERMEAHFVTELPKWKHSTLGLGSTIPDSKGDVAWPGEENLTIATGKPVQRDAVQLPDSNKRTRFKSSLLYNEYVVYNPAQARLRFVIEALFSYR